MRVCLILEGCYPYVRGGVSTWAQEYMKANSDIEFVIWSVHASREKLSPAQYELPNNVVEMREIFLEDAYKPLRRGKCDEYACVRIIESLSFVLTQEPHSWGLLFEQCRTNNLPPMTLANSEAFLQFAVNLAKESNDTLGLSDAYYGMKSMLLPIYYLLQQNVPCADLYHSAVTGYGGLLGSLAKYVTGKPFILTEHGIYPREREEELLQADWVVASLRETWISMFYNLSRCAYEYADRVTALFHEAFEKQVAIGCPPHKCRIVANGIHYDRFEDLSQRSDRQINIGAFLRFAPIKDIKTLIYAFYELNRTTPNVSLFLLGGTDDEQYKEECLSLIERLNLKNIYVEGHVNTVEYMKKMDFTVMSSISEGQPLAILESLAAARPCVTTNVGNCKALLECPDDEFGQAGFCCTPMDSVALSAAIKTLCVNEDLRKSLGQNGRKRVEKYYTHEKMVHKYLEIYREVT